ncbi:aldo/keto reductase [Reichenbachiella sp. MALMAid0571]|uniref:aldo/keto reductase n=1 Tax=Reichenbachiella sp. MALMAid0571 TaxID=3143939 RepID=UPI0032DFC85D
MKYRKIDKTDIELSLFGLGCWAFGGGDYWGGNHDQKEVNKVVHAAADLGVNYFDSAEVYNEGRSETSLGLAIKDLSRDKLIVGTKISPSNCFPGKIAQHCEASLKRLNTDYIDIYMVHWPIHPHSIRHYTNDEAIINNPPSLEEAMEGLLTLQKEGKIRYIGVSNHSADRLEAFPENDSIVINELPYNLLCRAPEYEILPYCKEKGIGVIGYMSLLQGILADLYPTIDDIPMLMRRTRHFDDRKNKLSRHGENGFERETQAALDAIRKISKEVGISMPDLALKWAVVNEAISTSLVGVRSVKRLEANIKAINEPLDQQIITDLNLATNTLKDKMGGKLDYYEGAKNDRT